MSNELELVKLEQPTALTLHKSLYEKTQAYIDDAPAENTKRGYQADWNDFLSWCLQYGFSSLPATGETVALYLADRADSHKASSLRRRIAAIAKEHRKADQPDPTKTAAAKDAWRGIRKKKGIAPKQKAAVDLDILRQMIAVIPTSIAGLRDRALLLIGFAGAFRRSELVSLQISDLQFRVEGLVITLRRSKTDQEGASRQIAIPYGINIETCPVRALQEWLRVSVITNGPVFRAVSAQERIRSTGLSDKTVALVVKRYATAAGLDASLFGGHSLRAGLATTAARAGLSERDIMSQTGHRSVEMVRKYIRAGNLFNDSVAGKLGL